LHWASIHVKDIAAPKGVTILSTPDTVVVAVLAPHKVVEEVSQPVAEEVQPAEEQQ
jgi:hypothetical protein